MPQLSALEYLKSGDMPFFRLPRADTNSLKDVDAALIGVTWDHGATYQPGARFAPFHLRRVSALVQSYHPMHRLDVFGTLRAVDAGNVAFPPFEASAMRTQVATEIARIAGAGAAPFVVGGDHSVSLPVLRSLHEEHGPLTVVHFDAHMDTSGPEVWGEAHHHGTPFRHAILEGLVGRGQLIQVGLRSTWGSARDRDLAAEHDVRQISSDEVAVRGVQTIAQELRERTSRGPVYISFDVDAIDPAYAPGTGTPVPGGLTSREAFQLMRSMAGAKIIGMDLVEIAPNLDHADLTLHLGAHLLFEGLALLALRRK
jgi:agmatinase